MKNARLSPAVALCALLFALASCASPPATSGGAPPALHATLDAACGVLLCDGQQQATCFLVSADGWVLTAAHATMGSAPLTWDSPSLGLLPLERVAADPAHDIALLRLPAPAAGKPYPCLPIAAADPAAGTAVFGFGNPMLRRRLLVAGMLAEAGTSFEYLPDLGAFAECRHIAGGTIPGMSGGPWVTAQGDVVGIQSGGISAHGAMQDICWAAPRADMARMATGRRSPDTADLGAVTDSLYETNPEERQRFPAGAAGALVRRLHEGSALAAAGITPGSLIEKAGGIALGDRDSLLRVVRAAKPGSNLILIVRGPDGQARECTVKLGRLYPFARPAHRAPARAEK